MSFVVTAVPVDQVSEAWQHAARWLTPAVARSGGRYDMAALYRAVKHGGSVLWLVVDADGKVVAAMTTHIAHYPLKDILSVDFIGGRGVRKWLTEVTDTLDRVVRAHRLAGLETCARFGWKHLLAERGWTQTMGFYERGNAS